MTLSDDTCVVLYQTGMGDGCQVKYCALPIHYREEILNIILIFFHIKSSVAKTINSKFKDDDEANV